VTTELAGPIRRVAIVVGVVLVLAAALTPVPTGAATPSRADGGDLRVVDYNILHGIFCDDHAGCRAPDRVALFLDQLVAARCPPVVGLQEVNDDLRSQFAARVPSVCGGRYHEAFGKAQGNDKEFVLTTLPARNARVVPLPGGLRSASRVELTSDLGPVVLVVTHQDGDAVFPACRDNVAHYRCPKPCPDGTTYPTCQTILGEQLASRGGPKRALRIYMGDFNVTPGTPRYRSLTSGGWTDTHLAARNAECDPATGSQCTSGRDDQSLAALQDPSARESERIDFIFVKPPPGCTPRFDGAADADGDGTGTGLFAATPAVGGPGGLVWPSDHTAVSMDMACA